MKRETRQITTQARYIRFIIIFVYTHCPFRWTVVIVKFKAVVKFVFFLPLHVASEVKKGALFSLEHGVIFEFYTKLLRFPST